MIPAFDPNTGNLPPGEHPGTWTEIVDRFGNTPWRKQLLDGLKAALESLRAAGCKTVYLDGSFVQRPGDFDACWAGQGVDFDLLAQNDPVLLTFGDGRVAQEKRYGGELFLADGQADAIGTLFRESFQLDRYGNAKGIIIISLEDLI